MAALETATTVTAVLNTIPAAANAGRRVYEIFTSAELKKMRQERDDAREGLHLSEIRVSELQEELSAAKGEIDENVKAMDVLARRGCREATGSHRRDHSIRGKAKIAYWAGGVVIVVLVIALVCLAKQN